MELLCGMFEQPFGHSDREMAMLMKHRKRRQHTNQHTNQYINQCINQYATSAYVHIKQFYNTCLSSAALYTGGAASRHVFITYYKVIL